MPIDFEMIDGFGLDEIILGNLKEGQIVTAMNLEEDKEKTIHYDIQFVRELMKDVYSIYSSGDVNKKKFVELFDKHHKKFANVKGDFLERLADKTDDLFLVEKKQRDKNGNVTIKLKKLDNNERLQLVETVSKKLASKLTKKQITEILAEGIKKHNTIDQIRKMSEQLAKNKKSKVEGNRGCYKLVIDDTELMVTM